MAMFTRDQLTGENNIRLTKSLFIDMGEDPANIFTLRHETYKGCVPLRNLYLKYCVDDPSESTFAEEVFGDWHFWAKLREIGWFKAHLQEWREVADIKRKSIAFKYIVDEVKNDGRNGYQAAKLLLDEPWKGKTKAARAAAAKTTAAAAEEHTDDIVRIKDFIRS